MVAIDIGVFSFLRLFDFLARIPWIGRSGAPAARALLGVPIPDPHFLSTIACACERVWISIGALALFILFLFLLRCTTRLAPRYAACTDEAFIHGGGTVRFESARLATSPSTHVAPTAIPAATAATTVHARYSTRAAAHWQRGCSQWGRFRIALRDAPFGLLR